MKIVVRGEVGPNQSDAQPLKKLLKLTPTVMNSDILNAEFIYKYLNDKTFAVCPPQGLFN